MPRHRLMYACVMATVGAFAAGARAAEIKADISSRRCQLDEVLTLYVDVVNPTQASSPVPEATDDFDIRQVGQPFPSDQTLIMNGRVTRTQSYKYRFELRPRRAGRLTVPGFVLKDGGQTYQTQPIVVVVGDEKGPRDVFCRVVSSRESAYVGQAVGLRLEIWVRVYRQAGLGVIGAETLFRCNDFGASSFGVFKDAVGGSWNAQQREYDDESYYVYICETTVYPSSPGPFDFGEIVIGWDYPTELGRDVFGGVRLDMAGRPSHRRYPRSVRADAELPSLVIKAIPVEGRPPDYNGAIGRFRISTRARPTQAPVGDPITLTMVIRGDVPLDGLRPPRLDQVAALKRDFEISGESLAGEMEAGQKIFSQTIRALREDVKQIPPIPFSFFNPDEGVYETAWSEPIGLEIGPAQRLALPTNGQSLGPLSATLTPLTETLNGLQANCMDVEALLASGTVGFGAIETALLALMPAGYVATWIVARRSARYRADHALRRRHGAYGRARKALQDADRSDSASGASGALVAYVADRCNVPEAGLTRAETLRLLEERGADAGVCREMDALLESIEFVEYSGAGAMGRNNAFDTARRVLDGLERGGLR